jgi:hypothetical protein
MRNIDAGHDTNLWTITSDTSVTSLTATYNGETVFTLHDNGSIGFPSHTTTERDALTDLAAGQTIYNSTTNKLNFYNGSAWEAVTSA